jgi:hypothetical protein
MTPRVLTPDDVVAAASRCQHFIGLTVRRWPDATNDEVGD